MRSFKLVFIILFTVSILTGVIPARAVTAAQINIADGDVIGLIAALNTANGNGQTDTINLADNGVYDLVVPDNLANGFNGLPSVTTEITINGNGSTIHRIQNSFDFRIFHVGNTGNLTLNDIIISGGSTTENGGGIFIEGGVLNLSNSTLKDNLADIPSSSRNGGGVYNNGGSLIVTDSTIENNLARQEGGGLYSVSGILRIDGSTINGNTARISFGGGIVSRSTNLEITSTTISNNNCNGCSGGGIFIDGNSSLGDITLSQSTLIGNTGGASGGGGIHSRSASYSITDSTISGNSATDADGGGISNRFGSVIIKRSTLSGNDSERGGGIFNGFGGTAELINSTVSGNESDNGGGLYNLDSNTMVSNSTFTKNQATNALSIGGGIFNESGDLLIKNSIVAGNVGVFAGPDCFGSITSMGYTLVGDESGCSFNSSNGDIVGSGSIPIDPLLGPLQDNGGFTPTHSILPGSQAIDSIPLSDCSDISSNMISSDQRGITRPQKTECDIGSFELIQSGAKAELSITKVALTDPAIAGDPMTYEITVNNTATSTATGVMLSDNLPIELDYLSDSRGCSYKGAIHVLECSLGDIAAASSTKVMITGKPNSDGLITNTAMVSADNDPIGDSTSVDTTVLPGADLLVTIEESQDPILLNEEVSYTFILTNQGPSDSTDIILTSSIANQTTQVEVAHLLIGEEFSFDMSIAPEDVGIIEASAIALGNESDPDPTNNSAIENTLVQPLVPPICTLNVAVSYQARNQNMVLDLGFSSRVSTVLQAMAISGNNITMLMSKQLPGILPTLHTREVAFPRSGVVILLTTLSRPNGDVICADLDLVNTTRR